MSASHVGVRPLVGNSVWPPAGNDAFNSAQVSERDICLSADFAVNVCHHMARSATIAVHNEQRSFSVCSAGNVNLGPTVMGQFGVVHSIPFSRGAHYLQVCVRLLPAPFRAPTRRCRRNSASRHSGRHRLSIELFSSHAHFTLIPHRKRVTCPSEHSADQLLRTCLV